MKRKKTSLWLRINWRQLIVILSMFTVLTLLPLVVYLYLLKTVTSVAWYDSNWPYRVGIDIGNSTEGDLLEEDVLVEIDTQTLISSGKMQSNCGDIRFMAEDNITEFDYWIEDGCNTESTRIWVRLSTLPLGGSTIYMYYGNQLVEPGGLTWTGGVMMFADNTCPTGWTRVEELDGRFLYGSSEYGNMGGDKDHSHADAVCTSSSISSTNLMGGVSGTLLGVPAIHTHDNLKATIDVEDDVLPPYLDMVMCYRNTFLLNQGLISMFSSNIPAGWERFDELDNKFPRMGENYGEDGGSINHVHEIQGGLLTSLPSMTQNLSNPINMTGGNIIDENGERMHVFTSNGTLTVTNGGSAKILLVGGGGGGGSGNSNYWGAGGGGGGGLVYYPNQSLGEGQYAITIGAGGARGSKGSDTTFTGLTTALGGGKGVNSDNTRTGVNGGCGGGGSGYSNSPGGTGSQGANGGGTSNNVTYNASGGGGNLRGGHSTSAEHSAGGAGSDFSQIFGTQVGDEGWFRGGGGGGVYFFYGIGPVGGKGGGATGYSSQNKTVLPAMPNTGGGGGGSYRGNPGSAGGSGVVLVRYPIPLGTIFPTSDHTHESVNVNISEESQIPPYMDVLFAKSKNEAYVEDSNILIFNELPPLGWNRFVDLDDRIPKGGVEYGGTGGNPIHQHQVEITTGGPSSLTDGAGGGSSFADDEHTHSCITDTNSISNYPPYMTVIFGERKLSQETTILEEETDNTAPDRPTSLLCEGLVDPKSLITYSPRFSAIFLDEDDEGLFYQIEVNTSATFDGTVMWDSGKVELNPPVQHGERSTEIMYGGEELIAGVTYYWRIKFWDINDEVSPWSRKAEFRINNNPNAPTELMLSERLNPILKFEDEVLFSARFVDPDPLDQGMYYQVQMSTSPDLSGILIWDSQKREFMNPAVNNAQSGEISLEDTTLVPGVRYYWRIKFWDSNGGSSEWSNIANFTVQLISPTSLLADDIQRNSIRWSVVDSNSNTLGYKIYNEDDKLVKFCLVSQMNDCTETGLLSNTAYRRKVKAYNEYSESENTGVFIVTTLAQESSITSVEALDSNSIRLNVSGSSRDRLQINETGRNIFFDSGLGILRSEVMTIPYANTFLIQGLEPNVLYTFRIRSLNNNGRETRWSSALSTYTHARIPGVLRVNRVTDRVVRVFVSNVENPPDTEIQVRENNTGRILNFTTGLLGNDNIWGLHSDFGGSEGIIVANLEVGSQYGFSVRARNKNMIETGWSEGIFIGTAAILRNVSRDMQVMLANNERVDLTNTTNAQFGKRVVRVRQGEYLVADIPVLFSQDRDWSDVLVLSSADERKSVVKVSEKHGVVEPFTMYVVQGDSNAFILCPEAKTLEEVTLDCPKGIRFVGKFPASENYEGQKITVSQATIGGIEYWIADGITGTGGHGYYEEERKIPEADLTTKEEKKSDPLVTSPTIQDRTRINLFTNLVDRALELINVLPITDMNEDELRKASTTANVVTVTVGATALLGGLTQLGYSILQGVMVLLSSLGFRKKRVNYGFVYDSNTKDPIHMALVRIYNKKRLVETAVTDINGRFSASLKKAKYDIKVSKSGYEFPSVYVKGPHDYPLQNVYTEGLDISSEDADVQIAIPIDPKEILGGQMVLYRAKNIFLRLLSIINVFIFLIGVGLSSYTYYVHRNSNNLLLLFLYIIPLYILINSFFNKKGKYGKIVDEKGKPLSNISITIREKEFNKVVAKRVTNAKGRYRFILDKGKYELDVAEKGWELVEIKRGTFIDVRKDNYILAERIKVKKS